METELLRKHRAALWLRSLLCGEKCACCGENTTRGQDILCDNCAQILRTEAAWFCPTCGARVIDCLCVPSRLKTAGISAFVKLFPYVPGAGMSSGTLLFRLKEHGDRLLTLEAAELWADRVLPLLLREGVNAAEVSVTFIPRSRKRVREYGTDQARALARALADRIGCAFSEFIVRKKEGEMQKSLSRSDRERNASALFSCRGPVTRCVLLVDDLVTTGETVAACAHLLKKNGARTVFCAALAQTVGTEAEFFPPDVDETAET